MAATRSLVAVAATKQVAEPACRRVAVPHRLRPTTFPRHPFVLAALLCCSTVIAPAQESFWLHGNLGLAAGDNYPANSQSIAAYYRHGSLTYSARFVNTDRIKALFNWNSPAPNLDKLQHFGISVGYSRDEYFSMYGISAGFGMTRGRHNHLMNNERFTVPSALLEVWGGMKLFDSFGVGITALGNLNSRRSYGAASASLFVRVF